MAALGLDERSPASLIVFVISKCVHMAETRSCLTVNDGKQIKDMLSEYNDRVCCCVPTSAATSNDAINIDKGPWTNIDINSSLTFGQLRSLTGVKVVKLVLENLRTFEPDREKPLRDYRDVLGYRKKAPPKRTLAR